MLCGIKTHPLSRYRKKVNGRIHGHRAIKLALLTQYSLAPWLIKTQHFDQFFFLFRLNQWRYSHKILKFVQAYICLEAAVRIAMKIVIIKRKTSRSISVEVSIYELLAFYLHNITQKIKQIFIRFCKFVFKIS